MTNDEIKQTLKQVDRILGLMDKEHLNDLLQALLDSKSDQKNLVLSAINARKNIKTLITGYIQTEHLCNQFRPRQIKSIYKIISDYNYYPRCQLCGQPIKVITKGSSGSALEFTWDHIYPKSLGGSGNLVNMQATHKLCNQMKGSNIVDRAHYTVNIIVTINTGVESLANFEQLSKKTSKRKQQLRKQDTWCHKQRNQNLR